MLFPTLGFRAFLLVVLAACAPLARANAARAVLSAEGLASDRISEVSGKAGADPLLPDDPYGSANRRIAIILMREAPPIPAGHRL